MHSQITSYLIELSPQNQKAKIRAYAFAKSKVKLKPEEGQPFHGELTDISVPGTWISKRGTTSFFLTDFYNHGNVRKFFFCPERGCLGESRKFTRSSRCGFVAQWLERATRIRKILGSIPGGAALCFFV